jgi:hypothetical protein
MAIDAFITVLGPARVELDFCEDRADYERARRREIVFIEALERELSARLGVPAHLESPLVPHRSVDGPEIGYREASHLPPMYVGHDGEGLTPLRAAARDAGLDAPHLMDHDSCTGLYLPIGFPRPFLVRNGDEDVSVGSAIGLDAELARLEPILTDPYDRTRASNLQTAVREALARGLAIELA